MGILRTNMTDCWLVEEPLAYFPPCPAKLDRESRSN